MKTPNQALEPTQPLGLSCGEVEIFASGGSVAYLFDS